MEILQKIFLLASLIIFVGVFVFGLFCKNAGVSMMCMYAGIPIIIVVGVLDIKRFNKELEQQKGK